MFQWLMTIAAPWLWELFKANMIALHGALCQGVATGVVFGMTQQDILSTQGILLLSLTCQVSVFAFWVFNLWAIYKRKKRK